MLSTPRKDGIGSPLTAAVAIHVSEHRGIISLWNSFDSTRTGKRKCRKTAI